MCEENLSLPYDLVLDKRDDFGDTELLHLLWEIAPKLKPPPPSHHIKPAVHTPKKLEVWTHVLVKTDATWEPLHPPYESPYKMLKRIHAFSLNVGGKSKTTSLCAVSTRSIYSDYTTRILTLSSSALNTEHRPSLQFV